MNADNEAKNKRLQAGRIKAVPRPPTAADWVWLETNRLPRLDPDKDAVELVRELRDQTD
jgi:hypothetical protein